MAARINTLTEGSLAAWQVTLAGMTVFVALLIGLPFFDLFGIGIALPNHGSQKDTTPAAVCQGFSAIRRFSEAADIGGELCRPH
jgi:hypothetical protein